MKFKIYDVNNIISYESEYDPNTKAYYFVDTELYSNGFIPKNIDSKILPDYVTNELRKIDFENYSSIWGNKSNEIVRKYAAIDSVNGGVFISGMKPYMPMLSVYVPMILEKVNHQGDCEPIKKWFFPM